MIRCPQCDRELPETAYAPDRSRPSGLSCYCRECRNAYQRAYRCRRATERAYADFLVLELMKSGRYMGKPVMLDVTRGDSNRMAKLTEEQVREIYPSKEPRAVLAQRYGVSVKTIDQIRSRRRWAHLWMP